MTFGSTYERFFGRYHADVTAGDAEILKHKRFGELKLASHLNPQAKSYIENWILLKEDEYYVGLVVAVVRNLFTFLKNLKPKVSQYTDAHYRPERHELMSASRFDTIELAIKKQSHKNVHNANYNRIMKEYMQHNSSLTPNGMKGLQKSATNRVVGVTP
jgi:hypothetical protein